MSRTPVRMALVRLEEEGLIEAIPSGGFAVKAFSERDIFLRGVMTETEPEKKKRDRTEILQL